MPGPRIILVGTKEAANVGSVARAMLNFGLHDLVLVAPRCSIDARAHALATHAGEVLDAARVVDTLAEAVADRRLVIGTSARRRTAENFPVMTAREAAPVLLEPSVALVFGPEDHGLDNHDLNLCQAHVVVPTDEFSSLNLAQAVVVVAYEVFQARLAASSESADGAEATPGTADGEASGTAHGGASGTAHGGARRKAEAGATAHPGVVDGISTAGLVGRADRYQLEGLYAHLLETFHLIGFTDASRARSIDRLMRGLFDRVALAPREVAALRGFLSQVAWAAHQPPDTFAGSQSASPQDTAEG